MRWVSDQPGLRAWIGLVLSQIDQADEAAQGEKQAQTAEDCGPPKATAGMPISRIERAIPVGRNRSLLVPSVIRITCRLQSECVNVADRLRHVPIHPLLSIEETNLIAIILPMTTTMNISNNLAGRYTRNTSY